MSVERDGEVVVSAFKLGDRIKVEKAHRKLRQVDFSEFEATLIYI